MAAATDPRTRWRALRVASALILLASAAAAQAEANVSRGEALYTNHCVACHTCQAHTRRDPLVKNMGELVQQVDRWQASQRLGWKSDERAAVVEYLNRTFYKF